MAERTLELDQEPLTGTAADAVQAANERAERAEAELARLKGATPSRDNQIAGESQPGGEDLGGEEALRQDPTMSRLLDALAAGEDIGHYGRLTFAIVARHFLPHNEVLRQLTNDRDFSEPQAKTMLLQVEERDYSPPRRERLLQWQSEQNFKFINESDPDDGNLYRSLKFARHTYDHIEHYEEEKASLA